MDISIQVHVCNSTVNVLVFRKLVLHYVQCHLQFTKTWNSNVAGEGYVIRWAYFVLADRIVKDRKSRCRSTVAGRVRCAYFFWQGNDCSVNEKGAAAIMAVELDEEKGPQVRTCI